MRESHQKQMSLTPVAIDHEHAKELDAVSRVLDSEPTVAELVTQDLLRAGAQRGRGAPGMSGDQVLRCTPPGSAVDLAVARSVAVR